MLISIDLFIYYLSFGWTDYSTFHFKTATSTGTYEVSNLYLHRFQFITLFIVIMALSVVSRIVSAINQKWIKNQLGVSTLKEVRGIIRDHGGVLRL